MKKTLSYIIKFRTLILLTILAITLVMGWQMKNLKINSDIISSLPDDDPAAVLYKEIGEKYQGSTIGIIIVNSENLYSAQTIADVATITDIVQSTKGVESVTSLANIINIKTDEYGLEVGNLVDIYALPETEEELMNLKNEVESNEMYKGVIVSNDGKSTIVMFTLATDVNQEEVGKEIKEKIAAQNFSHGITYGGLPMMMQELSTIIFNDMVWLIPSVAILLLIILFLSFKSVRGTILPLITVSIAITWTLGLMAILGYEITMIGGIIPVILFAVGSAYSIHVINHIRENQEEDYRKRILSSLGYLVLPVFLSSLTTVFGFVSFIFGSYLTMIKDFGIFCAVGTFFSFILALTFIPALISFFPTPPRRVSDKESLLTKKFLRPLSSLVLKYPKYVLIFWISLVILGIIGTFKIDRSTNLASFFNKKSETRIAEETLQEQFGGSAPVYVLFKGDVHDPDFLAKMGDFSDFLKTNPHISHVTSIVDLIEQMNEAMGEGRKLPTDRAKIEQLWFLLEGHEVMEQLVSDDLDEAIIQTRFSSINTNDTKKFIDEVEEYITAHQDENVTIQLSGIPSVYVNMDSSLLKSQLSSLSIAIVLVLLLISISLKSFKLGIMGIVPILVTVSAVFGFMGFTGISLDVATVSVASIVLGIGIDYSIHTISSFNYYFKIKNDIDYAIKNTICIIGKSIMINATAVGLGFSVLLFSHLIPMKFMGLLIAISMLLSSIGALTLLPIMIIINHNYKNKLLTKKQLKTA
ncbi:MAG TPA: efflux RND transporter permease subunit [Bacteroidales bacterium]|nr:efflux RND transporter permease subunit [Bacteroidales bacterium]